MQSLIVLFLLAAAKVSCADKDYYTAGVVEFRPAILGSSTSTLRDNLNSYLEILHSAEAIDTDIIVFPESTLNNGLQLTYVPSAESGVIPCNAATDYADFLKSLSCAASKVRKYVLINVSEKEDCPAPNDDRPCGSSGLNIYNTNVVFDREGRVISRYRKWHIYLEPKNTTLQPEFAIFDTDFGVRFAHFICFDILFYTPSKKLVDHYGVSNFLFPNWFYSELPFLTAVQMQQSWAWGNNVNLLSAGASLPQYGTTGSGIYAGQKGTLAAIMASESGTRKLLVAQVPKKPTKGQQEAKSLHNARQEIAVTTSVSLMRDPRIEQFESELIDFVQDNKVSRLVCHGDFCCRFYIETEALSDGATPPESSYYKYRIGAFEGNRTYEKEEWSSLKICALYACTGDTVGTCGKIFNASTPVDANFHFKSIRIEGKFPKAKELLVSPNTLNSRLYPLNSDTMDWKVTDEGDYLNVQLKSVDYHEDLLTFAIYANYYDGKSSSAQHALSLSLLIASGFIGVFGWLLI